MGRYRRHLWQYGLLAFCLALLTVTLLYPISLTVLGGFAADPARGVRWWPSEWPAVGLSGWPESLPGGRFFAQFTGAHLAMIFENPATLSGLLNSFKIAACTTVVSILIAVPLAVLAAGYRFPGKGLFQAAVLVPMILPPFVGAIGVRALLGREGALNALLGTDLDILGSAKFFGVVAVQALSLYPIIFLNATAALANLDPALDEAAEGLGAGWWKRFFRITLPLVRPGIFAGATIVFIWSFTELGTPLMFDYYQVTPVQIFYGLKQIDTSAEPYALTFVLLATAVFMYIVGKLVFGRKGYAMYSKASRAGGEKVLSGARGWGASLAFAVVFVLAVLPHVGVGLVSVTAPGQWYGTVLPTAFTGQHFGQALTAPDSFNAIRNSLGLSAAAMLVTMVLGILIAYLIVRTEIKGRGVLDALCMLPLAVPGLVMAFGFVAMSTRWPFGKDGPLGAFASVFGTQPNPIPLLIIAYSVRRLPYIVRSTVAGLEQTSGELEEAAVNLGASRLYAVRRVIVPLILANIIAGGLLVFSFSMLEVSDSLLLAQQAQHYPLTKAIFAFTERLGDGMYIASAMGVWGMALLMITLFAASALLGKKLGSIFRV